jgi:hypothetical protein
LRRSDLFSPTIGWRSVGRRPRGSSGRG